MNREIVHKVLNKVFSIGQEGTNDSLFQLMTEAQVIQNGFVFVRNYIAPFDFLNDPFYTIERKFTSGIVQDFKIARKEMKAKVVEIGYAGATVEQLELLTKWMCIPSSVSAQNFTISQIDKFTKYFDENSKAVRKERMNAAIRLLRNAIPSNQLPAIITKIKPLMESYLEYGIEGTSEVNNDGVSDPTGIYDYIKSTSTYSSTGFSQESINPKYGFTINQLKNRIMDILENGNYL